MASNKVKRSLHLAQPTRLSPNQQPAPHEFRNQDVTHPESPKLMPVKVRAYRAMAELNAGFEKVIQELQSVRGTGYLPADEVTGMHNVICRIRAQANQRLTKVLHEREAANLEHFEKPLPARQR